MSARDSAVHFEALKLRIGQVKEGITLVLLLKTDETPPAIWQTPINQRYMVALVPIGDDEKPLELPDPEPSVNPAGKEAVRYAALLCKDEVFQRWMYRQGYARLANEHETAVGLRFQLGINSRSELASDPGALDAFDNLVADYKRDVGM